MKDVWKFSSFSDSTASVFAFSRHFYILLRLLLQEYVVCLGVDFASSVLPENLLTLAIDSFSEERRILRLKQEEEESNMRKKHRSVSTRYLRCCSKTRQCSISTPVTSPKLKCRIATFSDDTAILAFGNTKEVIAKPQQTRTNTTGWGNKWIIKVNLSWNILSFHTKKWTCSWNNS